MKTPSQLVLASLTELGGQIVAHQIALKLEQQEWYTLMDMVIECEERMDTLRLQIKALKDRALWNQREGERLGLPSPDAQQLMLPEAPPRDPSDDEGEAWKGA